MTKSNLLTVASLCLGLQFSPVFAGTLSSGQTAYSNQDYATAIDELAPLAKEGNPQALYLMGQMYEKGQGVGADKTKARQFYESGARQGNLQCVNALRDLKNEDYKVEFAELKPKADAGNPSAENRVGEMYEFGQGVKRDEAEAFSWYQKSAAQDYVAAWHNLGRAYNFGVGTEQDYVTAEQWYQKAAKAGDADAMFFLGTLYATEHGQDTRASSDLLAYAWLSNAAAKGNSTAATIKSRLQLKLSEAELTQADTLAKELISAE